MTAPDWTEFAARRPVLTPSSSSERYGTGNPIEKIADAGHIGLRRRRHPANIGSTGRQFIGRRGERNDG